MARKLGIANLLDRFPADVSGGEAQRAAIARAVVKDPKLIVADEPTSSLADESRDRAFGLFQELVQSGRTGVLATLTASDSGYLRDLNPSNAYSTENGQVTQALSDRAKEADCGAAELELWVWHGPCSTFSSTLE